MRTLRLGTRGTDVMEIQSLLKKIGYNPGPVDGIFGKQMELAVIAFQRSNGLVADGVVGLVTYNLLSRFLRGYDEYRIKTGDTIYKIARRYYTLPNRILVANPEIDPNNLFIGQKIIVPYGMDVVDTDIDYTYDIMRRDIEALTVRYPFIEVGVAGESVLGKELYYLKLGNGPNQVFYNAAHHSLEWITSPLLMKFVERFAKSYTDGVNLRGYNLRDIWNRSTIYIMPMVNPDGVDLVLNGLNRSNPYYENLIRWNNGSTNFSQVWQANIRGVDLNHNYNASWELSKEAERELGIIGPGPTRFSGPYPESEPESRTVADFARNHNFRLVLAYHSQGEIIYWNYRDMAPPVARTIGELFSRVSGYELAQTYGIASFAGYKDWFIERFGRPGYTIEVGLGKNPLPISQFNKIYNDNEEILILASIV